MPNPLQRTAGILRGAASAVRRPFSRSLTRYPTFQNAIVSASPVRRNTPLATSYGDRVLPQVIGGTPTEFQLELQKIIMNRLAAKNEKVREAFNAIAGELAALPESVSATPGFAGLNLDQARRLSSITEGGLQNLLSGLSSVIPQQQQRTDYLSGLATQAYAENLQQKEQERALAMQERMLGEERLQKTREREEDRALQLSKLALDVPFGQSMNVGGQIVRGLKPFSAGERKNRIVPNQSGGYYVVDDAGNPIGGIDAFGRPIGGGRQLAVPGEGPSLANFRTDRNNNPTAFITAVAKLGGLQEGVDYVQGDSFIDSRGNTLYTARLIRDPVETTIKLIDKIGFYNSKGQQWWSHTAMAKEQWNKLSPAGKFNVIKEMYEKEGGSGSLMIDPETALAEAHRRGLYGEKATDYAKGTVESQDFGFDVERFKIAQDLRKDFDDRTKDYEKAIDNVNLMNISLQSILDDIGSGKEFVNLAPESQGILVTFQKTLDPSSVVREQEYNRSLEGQSLVNQLYGTVTKWVQGGAGLTPEALSDYVRLANKWLKGYQNSVKNIALRTKKNAEAAGVPDELIFSERTLRLLPGYQKKSLDSFNP